MPPEPEPDQAAPGASPGEQNTPEESPLGDQPPARPGPVDDSRERALERATLLIEGKLEPRELVPRSNRGPAPSRTKPIAIRFDQFTLERLRTLADRRDRPYQTMLKEFVLERLYEEERREGIIE